MHSPMDVSPAHRIARSIAMAAGFLFVLSVASFGAAHAAVPSTMSYQGLLTDNTGTALPDGSYSLTFRIYNVATSGTALWTETKPAVSLSRGEFSVILGSSNPISLSFRSPYWLGVTVGANPELSPRVELAASPY